MDSLNPKEFWRTRVQGGRTPDRFSYEGLQFGAFAGAIIGWYAGLALFLPLVLTLAIGFIVWRLSGEFRRRFVPVFSVQAGQIASCIVGLILLGLDGPQRGVLIDIVLLSVGLIWLMAKRSRASLWFLAAYQLISLTFVVFSLIHAPLGSVISKGLAANGFLRVEALIFMFALYRQMGGVGRNGRAVAITE